MTLHIDFTPQEEAWLNAQAMLQGLPPAEVVRRLVDERLPELPVRDAAAIEAKRAATITYLEGRIREEATDDPEEIRKSEEEWEELKRNLNANRAAAGESPVFP
jgi:hypothetical protein